MPTIFANYDSEFQPLSHAHERLLARASQLLRAYSAGETLHPSYAVIGTFGAGKTQFLYWLHRQALELNAVPILFLAEDLFNEIIRGEKPFTQGDVAALVTEKV